MRRNWIEISEVTFEVTPQVEDTHYETDASLDDQVRAGFAQMEETYGLWGWCCVKVVARWKGLKAQTYLGACSYRHEEEFRQCGYFDDIRRDLHLELMRKGDDIGRYYISRHDMEVR